MGCTQGKQQDPAPDRMDDVKKLCDLVHKVLDMQRSNAPPDPDELQRILQKMKDIAGHRDEKELYTRPKPGHGQRRLLGGQAQWQNWGSSVAYRNLAQERHPTSADDVVAIVQDAKARSQRLRCIGHGHSWTPTFFDGDDTVVVFVDAIALDGDGDKRIRLVRPAGNGVAARVKIAPGVTTRMLAEWMDTDANAAQIGFVGLPTDVILDNVQYAGVISMACHGTGIHARTVSDQVVALTIVDGHGVKRSFSVDDDAPGFMPCLRASLGMTGVIVDLTLELDGRTETPYVQVRHDFPVMADYFGADDPSKLRDLVLANDGVEMFWMPLNSVELDDLLSDDIKDWQPYKDLLWFNLFTERVKADRASIVKYGYDNEPEISLFEQRIETQLGRVLNKFGCDSYRKDDPLQVSLRVLALTDIFALKMIQFQASKPGGYVKHGTLSQPKAIHYKNYIDDFTVYDFEECFRVDADFGNIHKAWKAVIDIATAEIKTTGFNTLNVAMEARFTRGSDVILSPAYSKDPDAIFVWLEVLCSTDTPLPRWLSFIEKVHKAWVEINSQQLIKPHWAKWNDVREADAILGGSNGSGPRDDWITRHVKEAYKAQIAEFNGVLQRLREGGEGKPVDFTNNWLRTIGFEA